MAVVVLPALLAEEAGGQKHFEVEAASVGEALRGLPVSDLLFDERGALRPLVNVFVDGVDERALDTELAPDAEIRVVAAVAGG